jgi:hypothetical protein
MNVRAVLVGGVLYVGSSVLSRRSVPFESSVLSRSSVPFKSSVLRRSSVPFESSVLSGGVFNLRAIF